MLEADLEVFEGRRLSDGVQCVVWIMITASVQQSRSIYTTLPRHL